MKTSLLLLLCLIHHWSGWPAFAASAEIDIRTEDIVNLTDSSAPADPGVQEFCGEEESACTRDKQAYQVISELHDQLDDDKDGEVDPNEADEFVRDALKYTDGFERIQSLHRHDNYISKLELWNSWKNSEAYNWTTDDIVDWLVNHVKLPEYTLHFQALKVTGPDLPKLAGSNAHYLNNKLMIKNPVHKKKIKLKTTDLILFGPPKSVHSPWKDFMFIVSLLLMSGGFWYATIQNRCSKKHIARINYELKQLLKAEKSLKDLKSVLEKDCDSGDSQNNAEHKALQIQEKRTQASEDSERLILAEEELTYLHELLLEKESRLIIQHEEIQRLTQLMINGFGGANGELQIWLQLCCEKERHLLSSKRASVNSHAISVKEELQKLSKKKSGFIGSFRVDVSGHMEVMESKISDINDALQEVKQDYVEFHHRWSEVEGFTGMQILNNAGLKVLQSNAQDLPSSNNLMNASVNRPNSLISRHSAGSSRSAALLSRPSSSANLHTRTGSSGTAVVLTPGGASDTASSSEAGNRPSFALDYSNSEDTCSAAVNAPCAHRGVVFAPLHPDEGSPRAGRRGLLIAATTLHNNNKIPQSSSSGSLLSGLTIVRPFADRWKKRADMSRRK